MNLARGRPPEDGVIRRLEISYLEGYVLGPEVIPSAEHDGLGDLLRRVPHTVSTVTGCRRCVC